MTDFGMEFNPDAIPESDREFDLLADQDVVAQPIESKMKASDDQTKHTLEVTWELLEGPNSGRRFWQNLKIIHPSQTGAVIDGRLLKQHFATMKILGVQRSFDPLMFQPVRIKIRTEKGSNGYKDKNVIKGYSAAGSAPASAPPASAPAPAAARPWGKAA